MGEIKSVKVDNWGVFFLQKLQNFFNKTDYCDMTLQFRDNSQLKVHRLVLSACTDYFNLLEESCEIVEGAVIMPNELQADVVVPIVNFMYTGTLEFELKMYGKLLRTAKEMNMTVLLKLLEAHRRTMEGVNRAQRPPSPKAVRRKLPVPSNQISSQNSQQQYVNLQQQGNQPQRRLPTLTSPGSSAVNQQRRSNLQTKTIVTNASGQIIQYRQQIGSTSVVRTSPVKGNQMGTVTYLTTGKHQIKREPDHDSPQQQSNQPTSPFEQLRKGYNNNKRPAVTAAFSPPAKKPNLEDVKEFAEQQRMRKQIAAEYGDDQEFDGMLDDDGIHNDDDDDDAMGTNYNETTASGGGASTAAQAQIASRQKQDASTTTIIVKQEQGEQTPTITVKDSSNSKINHAKIIQEVIRQYPHLAKSNKSIKLRILPSSSGDKVTIRKEPVETEETSKQQQQATAQILKKAALSPQITIKPLERRTTSQQNVQTATTFNKLPVKSEPQETNSSQQQQLQPQKRRIDSKTMHSLIALGAENTTGPWLCLRCGVNGKPISIPSYRGFRRHLINTHKEIIDPALCEHCGWRSKNNRELHYHIQVEHKIKTSLYTFPQCSICNEVLIDTNAHNEHMVKSHPFESKQACEYCKKIFRDSELYKHMRAYHRKQAIADGIMDMEDEVVMHEEEVGGKASKASAVKIISDISLNVPNTTRFVSGDGTEMILTDEQRKEIMDQLKEHEQVAGGVVMVLNEDVTTNQEAASSEEDEQMETKETVEEQVLSESQDDIDDSEIYKEFLTQTQNDDHFDEKHAEPDEKNTTLNECKDSSDNMEWAENLISSQDSETAADEAESEEDTKKTAEESAKKEIISKKVQELSCEWSEEEDDNEFEASETEKKNRSTEVVEEEEEEALEAEHEEIATEEIVAEETEKEVITAKEKDVVTEKDEETNLKEAEDIPKEDEKTDETDVLADDPKFLEKPSAGKDDGVDIAMKTLHEESMEDEEEELLAETKEDENDEATETMKVTESQNEEVENAKNGITAPEIQKDTAEEEKEPEQQKDENQIAKDDDKISEEPPPVLSVEEEETEVQSTELTAETEIEGNDVLDELLKENAEASESTEKGDENTSNGEHVKVSACKEEDLDTSIEEFQDLEKEDDALVESESLTKPTKEVGQNTALETNSNSVPDDACTTMRADEVKSLISDWVDEDDETAVSAAPDE